jgi:prepilin-type processing-associated H-X9-DG protein
VLFLDERADFINFGNFGIDMTGFPDKPGLTQFIGDVPASYHNGAGSVSFVDGHVEPKRWLDARTISPQNAGLLSVPSPNNPDIVWLQEHATRKQ